MGWTEPSSWGMFVLYVLYVLLVLLVSFVTLELASVALGKVSTTWHWKCPQPHHWNPWSSGRLAGGCSSTVAEGTVVDRAKWADTDHAAVPHPDRSGATHRLVRH